MTLEKYLHSESYCLNLFGNFKSIHERKENPIKKCTEGINPKLFKEKMPIINRYIQIQKLTGNKRQSN